MGPKAPRVFYILIAQSRPPDFFWTHNDRNMLAFCHKPLVRRQSRTLVRNFWSMIPASGSNHPSKRPPSLCQSLTGRPVDGQTEISVTGGLQIWATCDARIYARPLALGGLGPRGELSFDYFHKDRKSLILGVWAAPGARETLPNGGGLRPQSFGGVWRPIGPV